jgi:hypothetical protein
MQRDRRVYLRGHLGQGIPNNLLAGDLGVPHNTDGLGAVGTLGCICRREHRKNSRGIIDAAICSPSRTAIVVDVSQHASIERFLSGSNQIQIPPNKLFACASRISVFGGVRNNKTPTGLMRRAVTRDSWNSRGSPPHIHHAAIIFTSGHVRSC